MRSLLLILLVSSFFVLPFCAYAYTPQFWDNWWRDRTFWKDGKIDTTMTPDYPFNDVPASYHFKTVLQIGSGDGKYIKYLIEKRKWKIDTYIGIDWSAEAMNLIQQRQDQGDFGQTEVVLYQEDFSYGDLGFIDSDSVDLVFSINSLANLNNTEEDMTAKVRLMSEIARVLRHDGSLLLVNEFKDWEPAEDMIRPITQKLSKGITIVGGQFRTAKTTDMIHP